MCIRCVGIIVFGFIFNFFIVLDDIGNVVDFIVLLNVIVVIIDFLCFDFCNVVVKFIVDLLLIVYVIFGLKKIDRSGIIREYVIEKKVLLIMKFIRRGDSVMIYFFNFVWLLIRGEVK